MNASLESEEVGPTGPGPRLSERISVAELKFWSTGRRTFSLGSLIVRFSAESRLYPKKIRAVRAKQSVLVLCAQIRGEI